MNEINEDIIIGFDADSFEFGGELTLVAHVLAKLGCSIAFTGDKEELEDAGLENAILVGKDIREDFRYDIFFQSNLGSSNVDTSVLIYT